MLLEGREFSDPELISVLKVELMKMEREATLQIVTVVVVVTEAKPEPQRSVPHRVKSIYVVGKTTVLTRCNQYKC